MNVRFDFCVGSGDNEFAVSLRSGGVLDGSVSIEELNIKVHPN